MSNVDRKVKLCHRGDVYDIHGKPKYAYYTDDVYCTRDEVPSYTVDKICVGNGTHKLQAEYNPFRELHIKWKQKQEENMKSNIKYYTSLEMVEKIKNGFGEKMGDGDVSFKARVVSEVVYSGTSHIRDFIYNGRNFYSYSFPSGLELLPIDITFGIDEPAFKPIQPKIVHIDFHGVVIPAFEHEISGMKYITCDEDGLIRVYKKYPHLSVNIFSPTLDGYRYLNHIYKYEGDWKQSCTEIKLVECE